MKKLCARLAVVPLLFSAACVGSEKSANPLSPVVAGPIPGVGISAPAVVAPAVDALVDTNSQPITLQVANAETSGVRPLSYRFEVATDPSFANPVFARDGVPNDASGHTSMTLPGPLSPDRKYFWHARAEDGANVGPFGATSAFNIFTPVIFGAPRLLAPVGGITTSNSQPTFVIGTVSYSGPAGSVAYQLEISTSSSFGQIVDQYQFFQTGNRTELTSPAGLPAGLYFWRARAYDSRFGGPFSGAESFRVPAAAPGGGPENPGQPCGPPFPTTPLGILQCRRSQYPSNMSSSNMIAFLRASARDFNAAGIPNGPYGVLRKTGGNQCGGFSCDILCSGQGPTQKQWDVIGGVEGHPVRWGAPIPDIREDVCVAP